MATLQASVDGQIDAAPSAVFEYMSDPSRMHEWVNGVQSARWEDGSTLQAGGRFDMEYKYGRKVNNIKMEITAVDSGSLLEYKTVEGPYPIRARFTLRPSGSGTALNYYQIAFSDSKMAALGFVLTGWFAKPMVRRMLRKDIAKLAAAVEASS